MTGRLHPREVITLAQANNTQAGPITLLGMVTAFDDPLGRRRTVRTDLLRPVDDATRRPVQVFAMGLGHMRRIGRVPALAIVAHVTGHTLALVQCLHHSGGQPHLHFLALQLVGHTVVVAQNLNVVVDVDRRLKEVGQFIPRGRQRLQCRLVQFQEQILPRVVQFLEGALVDLLQPHPHRLVQLVQREERVVAQWGQHFALDDLHAAFHLGAVARLARAPGDHSDAVVPGHVQIGRVRVRLVPARPRDPAFQVVGRKDLGRAAQAFKRAQVRVDPVGDLLGTCRLGVEVMARSQRRHKNLRVKRLAADWVVHRHGHAGVVDEQPLAGRIRLTQAHLDRLGPAPIVFAILAVPVPLRIGLAVFLPQQPQRHAPPLEFFVELGPLRNRTLPIPPARLRLPEKPNLQLLFRQLRRQWPVQPARR